MNLWSWIAGAVVAGVVYAVVVKVFSPKQRSPNGT